MNRISTLPRELQPLMAAAPLLRCTQLSSDELRFERRYAEEQAHIERMMRDRMARDLGDKVMERATLDTEYDRVMRSTRLTASVVVMSEAELAVLLTRAHQAR